MSLINARKVEGFVISSNSCYTFAFIKTFNRLIWISNDSAAENVSLVVLSWKLFEHSLRHDK
jgi:hypothetical protein